jgi:hypothetical protein
MGVQKIKHNFFYFEKEQRKPKLKNQHSPNTPTLKTQHCPQC